MEKMKEDHQLAAYCSALKARLYSMCTFDYMSNARRCFNTYRWLVVRPALLTGILVCSPVHLVHCNKQKGAQRTNMSLNITIYSPGFPLTIFSSVLFVVLLKEL